MARHYEQKLTRRQHIAVWVSCILFVVIYLLALSEGVAHAQEAGVLVEPQVAVPQSGDATARMLVTPYIGGDRVGAWGFLYGEREYFSFVAGPYVTLAKRGETTLEVGAGVGLERFHEGDAYGNHTRLAGYMTLEGPKGKLQYYHENGATRERWIQAEATWNASKALGLGYFYQTDDGGGPRLIVGVPKTPLKVWAGPMWKGSGSTPTLLAGLDLEFGK